MEERVERIIIKKFHIKNAALFGLYHGIIMGLIFGLLILCLFFTNSNLMSKLPGPLMVSNIGDAAVLAFIVFVSYTVFSVISAVVTAIVYDLIAKMGGAIHFGLVEAEKSFP